MSDFTNYSNYNPQAAYSVVKFGSNALLLEVELNEMQNILNTRIRSGIKEILGDGFLMEGTLSKVSSTVTLADERAVINGCIVPISSLSVTVADGNYIWIDIYESEVTYNSSIKLDGNQQESTTVTNYIKDSRVSEETTRRNQIMFTMVAGNTAPSLPGHTYLLVGNISTGTLVDRRLNLKLNNGSQIYVAEARSSSSINDYTLITYARCPSEYFQNMIICFTASAENTDIVTVEVVDVNSGSSLGIKGLKKGINVDLEPADIVVGQAIMAVYDGSNFQIVTGAAGATSGSGGSLTPGGGGTLVTSDQMRKLRCGGIPE